MKHSGIAQILLDQVIDFSELMRKLIQVIYTAVICQESINNSPPNEKSNKDNSKE